MKRNGRGVKQTANGCRTCRRPNLSPSADRHGEPVTVPNLSPSARLRQAIRTRTESRHGARERHRARRGIGTGANPSERRERHGGRLWRVWREPVGRLSERRGDCPNRITANGCGRLSPRLPRRDGCRTLDRSEPVAVGGMVANGCACRQIGTANPSPCRRRKIATANPSPFRTCRRHGFKAR